VNLEAAKFCREINGDLLLEPSFATIGASALPYLTKVTGDVKAESIGATQSILQSITLPALQAIDGDLRFASLPSLRLVNLPRLTSIGGALSFGLLGAQRISLPELAIVQGDFSLTSGLTNLTQFDIGKLRTVGGTLNLFALCRLPWSQVQAISTFGATRVVSDIGCCAAIASHECVNNICQCN
jgi:hypothetical protein